MGEGDQGCKDRDQLKTMKLPSFEYASPATLAETIAPLGAYSRGEGATVSPIKPAGPSLRLAVFGTGL